MKKSHIILLCIITVLCIFFLASCQGQNLPKVSFDVDFANSSYKHINNGGVKDDATLPYNIDAITGATLTVEGPAVVSSTPLSIRELENLKEGIVKGQYKDKNGIFNYEGLDLYHLLYNMSKGDSGIILTNGAYKLVLKNSNREEIASLTIEEVVKAHNEGRPAILAYGIGTKDESKAAPFVFDGADKKSHSLGYINELKNDDGCIKLVYDNNSYGNGKYKEFSNVAYVYVCEETEPGFKHSDSEVFSASKYEDYIITVRGSALNNEFDLTIRQLEELLRFDNKGQIEKNSLGYRDWYSLANNAYWYVNEYEGLKLYEFLQYLGMQSAEEMGTRGARTTLVKFIASDGVAANEMFSVEALSYPEGFGFYKKNAQDAGNGTYVPTNADLVKLGYPVLLSFGVNNYPYVVQKTDPNYVSGLSNSGGPVRVVFGKTQYNHPNGSNQIQYLSEIIVGEDILNNTHTYQNSKALSFLAESKVKLTVNNADGKLILSKDLAIRDIENIIYGEDVDKQTKKLAKVKDSYEVNNVVDIYEGVDAEFFLMEYAKIPGMNGTITIKGNGKELTISLEELFASGYNKTLNRDGLSSVFAFAKNGTPLVKDENSEGYIKSIMLNPFSKKDAKEYKVENAGGPLCFIKPSTTLDSEDSQVVFNVESIEVNLIPDSYAHLDPMYSEYQNHSVKFYGAGLEREYTFTVGDIEGMQTKVKTLDYSILDSKGNLTEERYRGISIYELFKQIGINNNAGDVTVYCNDGSSYSYSLLNLKKSFTNFINPNKEQVNAMLCYGVSDVNEDKLVGTPLTSATGGPLKLVIPQETKDSVNKGLCLKNVVSVHVSANEITTWGHAMSDVFSEFLEYKFNITFKNDEHEVSKEYTLKELEGMEDIIVNDKYTVLDIGQCEGLEIWKLLKKAAGNTIDISAPISINAIASDGYANDLLANCGLAAFTDGIASDTGERKVLLLSYAQNGYPLVDTEGHEGYTGMAKNCDGPLRVVVEGFQGGSIKCCNKIVVTLPGSEELTLN